MTFQEVVVDREHDKKSRETGMSQQSPSHGNYGTAHIVLGGFVSTHRKRREYR